MDVPNAAISNTFPPLAPIIGIEWQLEKEALEWTALAEEQSQKEATAPLEPWRTDLASTVLLTDEPSRHYLNQTVPHEVDTDKGTYQVVQVQARAGEDRGGIQVEDAESGVLAIVLDGHSPAGARIKGAAQYALDRMGDLFYDRISKQEHPLQAFCNVLSRLEDEIERDGLQDGTTVTACYHDELTHTLYGATLGDSSATLYTRTKQGMLEVHRLAYCESWDDPQALHRVPKESDWRVQEGRIQHGDSGRLAVTRALGDRHFSPAVCADPILWMQTLDPEAEHVIVLASDGLSDWLTELECGSLIQNWSQHRTLLYPNYSSLAELLTAKARQRAHAYYHGRAEDPDRVIDDITVITFVSKGF